MTPLGLPGMDWAGDLPSQSGMRDRERA